MKFVRWSLAASLWLSGSHFAAAEDRNLQVCLKDTGGRAIVGGRVQVGATEGLTDGSGCVTLVVPTAAGSIQATRDGFASATQAVGSFGDVTLVLQPATLREVVDVTTARTPLALDATASSVRLMSDRQLDQAPGIFLVDKLRQVAGFHLFRRTSSWVANPTTQGTSLRGLGSTAASRTLVLGDQVPLNDAFGGWIHWNEVPQLAVSTVELMRGGASDLYGSSAIGGVIDVNSVRPEKNGFALDLSGASRNTSLANGLGTLGVGKTQALAAATLFRTDGYTLIAPAVRGAVDVPSKVD